MSDCGVGNGVLFVRHYAFGDALLTTPFLRVLQEELPGATIDLFSLSGEVVVEGVPGFGRWISMHSVSPKCVIQNHQGPVFWFSYEHDPTLHILDGYEMSTGLKLRDRTLTWQVDPTHRDQARQRLEGLPRPLIGFSPVCGHTLRTLPMEKSQEIVDLISKRFGGSVVVTSEQKLELTGCHNLAGQLPSIRDLAAIIAACDVWVTVDSAPLHLAQALGVQAVGIFGCTLPELRATRPSHLRIVRNETLKCLGCYHRISPRSETLLACDRGDTACLSTIDAEAVVRAIGEALEGRPSRDLDERMENYARYRARRIEDLPEGYAKAVVEAYRARILKFHKKFGFFKRMKQKLRQHRNALKAWWSERG